MATQPIAEPLVSVEEYLRTVYEHDCEYNEGVIEERDLGEFEHSFVQGMLTTLLNNHIEAWGVFALPEQRIKLRPRRYVVPDVAVLRIGTAREKVLTRPPLVVIEIRSPEDRLTRVMAKTHEYAAFGVEYVWVIDEGQRKVYRGTTGDLEPVPSGILTVPGTPIGVDVNELFAKLDKF